MLTILADKGDHGGQKSGAIVRVTVSSLMSPPPTVKLVHLKKIRHYLGYIMGITVLCI